MNEAVAAPPLSVDVKQSEPAVVPLSAKIDFSNEPVQGPITAEKQAELDSLKEERQRTEIDTVGDALLKQHTGEVNRVLADKKTTPEQRAALESAQSTKALKLIDWVRNTQAVQDGGVSLTGDAPVIYIGGKEYRPKTILKLEGDEYTCLDFNGQKMPVVHRNQLMNALLISERSAIVGVLPTDEQGAMNAYIDLQIAQAKGEEYIPPNTAVADIESATKSAGFITAEVGRSFAKKNIADAAKLKETLDFLEDKSMLLPDELGTVVGYSIDVDAVQATEAEYKVEIDKLTKSLSSAQAILDAADPSQTDLIAQLKHDVQQLTILKQRKEIEMKIELEQLDNVASSDEMFTQYYDMILDGQISTDMARQFAESVESGEFDALLATMKKQFAEDPVKLSRLQELTKHINGKNTLTVGAILLAIVSLMVLQGSQGSK